MIKFTGTDDFQYDVPPVSIVNETRDLEKRASAKHLLKFSKTKGQTDLHIIALGAYEGTGYNKNMDCFLEEDCKTAHDTFVKSGKVHKHHKNKKNDPVYGVVKASAYNEPMKRIELIIGLDNDKCADILQEQEKKGSINVSMGSQQQYDLCSFCGHRATSDKDRCEHIPAQLGQLNKHGEICGMINKSPNFFEISYVHRPADRIGMSLSKCASLNGIRPLSTSEYLTLYPGFQPPVDEILISKKASDKRFLLDKLAELEKHIEAVSTNPSIKKLRQSAKHQKLDATTIDELRKYDASKVLKILADHGIVFSPGDFCKYLFGDHISEDRVNGMKAQLPGKFKELAEDNDGSILNNERYEPANNSLFPSGLKDLIKNMVGSSSPMTGKMIRITIIANPKQEKEEPEVKTKEATDKLLADEYVAYKLAALNYLNENNRLDDDTLWLAVLQH